MHAKPFHHNRHPRNAISQSKHCSVEQAIILFQFKLRENHLYGKRPFLLVEPKTIRTMIIYSFQESEASPNGETNEVENEGPKK